MWGDFASIRVVGREKNWGGREKSGWKGIWNDDPWQKKNQFEYMGGKERRRGNRPKKKGGRKKRRGGGGGGPQAADERGRKIWGEWESMGKGGKKKKDF